MYIILGDRVKQATVKDSDAITVVQCHVRNIEELIIKLIHTRLYKKKVKS